MSSDRYEYIRSAAKVAGAQRWEILPSPRNKFFITVSDIPPDVQDNFVRLLKSSGKIWSWTVWRNGGVITFYEKDVASFFIRRWSMGAVFFYRRHRPAVLLALLHIFVAIAFFIWYFY